MSRPIDPTNPTARPPEWHERRYRHTRPRLWVDECCKCGALVNKRHGTEAEPCLGVPYHWAMLGILPDTFNPNLETYANQDDQRT